MGWRYMHETADWYADGVSNVLCNLIVAVAFLGPRLQDIAEPGLGYYGHFCYRTIMVTCALLILRIFKSLTT